VQGDNDPPQPPSWLAPQEPREGLGHYLEVVRERLRLIGACVVIAMLAAGLYATIAPRSWQAEAQLLISPVGGAPNLIGLGLITTSSSPGGDVSTAASLVTTPEVAGIVAKQLGGTSANALLNQVSAVPVAESNVVAITATASSPERAQAIANAFALGTVQNRTQALHRQLDAIIPALEKQVQVLPPAQQTGTGTLGERLATLQTLRAESDPTISISSLARRPQSPSWPRTKLSLLAGALAGLLLGLTAAFALEGLDPRVRREETLRHIFRLPVLARVPRERRHASRGTPLRPVDLSLMAQESYRMLRVALAPRGRSAGPRSVMVTGSTHSEGKSTVALNLAVTLASAQHSVILIEADLQRPSLAGALELMPRPGVSLVDSRAGEGREAVQFGERGMAGVLMGEIDLEDALLTVAQPDLGGNLRALLVEKSAHYLGDGLLASSDDLVNRAEALADYVVFDAPPVTEVSDALPLSEHVDAVVVVVRLGRSRTDQLINLGELLTRRGVRPAGLVVVGADMGQRTGYHHLDAPPVTRRRPRRLGRHAPAVERI
jgi:tyrosine-protein kinase